MNKKKKLLLSSIVSLIFCFSVLVGSTFALFTSESKTNIAINSGKVNVVATINANSVETKQLYDVAYTPGTDHTFDGNVVVSEQTVLLNKFVPGDGVKFTIDVANNSNVTIQYRTILSIVSDDGLFSGLVIKVDGVEYNGFTKVSNWATLTALAPIASVEVEIELPEAAGNIYQEKNCEIAYTVEAIQGNAEVEDVDPNSFALYSANDLMLFAKDYNANNLYYNDKTIEIMNDIDFTGVNWTPLTVLHHNSNGSNGATSSELTIEGNNHTISNMTFDDCGSQTGFVGQNSGNLTINNLKFTDVNITSQEGSFIGVVVGHSYGNITLNNVDVDGAYLYGKSAASKSIRLGALIGYTEGETNVSNCDVNDVTVIGYHNVAGFVGTLHSYLDASNADKYEFTNNTISNSNIVKTHTNPLNSNYLSVFACSAEYSHTREEMEAFFTNSGNSATSVNTYCFINEGLLYCYETDEYLISSAEGLALCGSKYFANGGTFNILNDIDMTGVTYTTGCAINKTVVINGNENEISNLAVTPVIGSGNIYSAGLISIGSSNLTIDGLTISNFSVTDPLSTSVYGENTAIGAFVSYAENHGANDAIIITNCHLKDSTVIAEANWNGGIYGYASVVYGTIDITNCSVTNTTISSRGSTGGIVGHANSGNSQVNVNITGCEVKNCVITASEGGEGNLKAGAIIGTVGPCSAYLNNCTYADNGNTVTSNGVASTGAYGRLATGSVSVN